MLFDEPKPACQIKMGTFSYLDLKNQLISVDFEIETCDDSDQYKQSTDYNQQLTDEWNRLLNEGFTNIQYKEIFPSPIF